MALFFVRVKRKYIYEKDSRKRQDTHDFFFKDVGIRESGNQGTVYSNSHSFKHIFPGKLRFL